MRMMSQSLGQQLQQARKGRETTLEEAAKATHIRIHYLQALEADDLEALPSKVQGRGFMRLYADYLGLNARSLLDLWDGGEVLPAEPLPAELPETLAQADGLIDQPSSTAPPPVLGDSPSVDLPPARIKAIPPATNEAHSDAVSVFQPAQPGTSQAIFRAIGQKLRDRRQALHLEPEDVERHTKLRARYLEALETGQIGDLPSPVQGRGMLSNYAHFLNLDVDDLLLKFAEGLQTQRKERLALEETPQPQPSHARMMPRFSLRRFISVDLIVVVLLVVSVFGFLVWGAAQVVSLRSQEPVEGTLPAVAEMLMASPSPTMGTASPAPSEAGSAAGTPTLPNPIVGSGAESTLSVTLPPVEEGVIQVVVVANQRAWMRMTVDGKVAFIGRTVPGTAYPFNGSRRIELTTGNGAALQVFYKQTDLGQLGQVGQVVNLVFTKDGMETPVPSATSVPTRTPQPVATQPLPTNTLPPPLPTATLTPAS